MHLVLLILTNLLTNLLTSCCVSKAISVALRKFSTLLNQSASLPFSAPRSPCARSSGHVGCGMGLGLGPVASVIDVWVYTVRKGRDGGGWMGAWLGGSGEAYARGAHKHVHIYLQGPVAKAI